MAKIYKIHPGIGIARVGKSEHGYFLAAETPGGRPLELSDTAETAFTGYKDNAHLMRRQGARFRIFEYNRNATGQETLVGEITAANAKIEWSVSLASRKAAGPMMRDDGHDGEEEIVVPGTGFRNDAPAGYTRDDLVASINLTATGMSFRPGSKPMAKFLKKDFYIGEVRTDFLGRLVVLGGMGDSRTWTAPPSNLVDFLNNKGWHDDITDGPVDAKITLNGSQQAVDAVGAWVVVGPPDFAPDITPITTLYDIAIQAHVGDAIGTVSYPMDIAPILERAARYYWVNEVGRDYFVAIQEALDEPSRLKDPSDANRQHRQDVADIITGIREQIISYRMTARQKALLERWAIGNFVPGPDPGRPEPNAAELIDASALAKAVGGGFFPGIEAGLLLRQSAIYSEFCRLTRSDFKDDEGTGSVRRLRPGSLTEGMACPWQADFMQCLGAWWPAQRPDVSRFTEAGAEQTRQWDRRLRTGTGGNHPSRKAMVDHFAQLGVIVEMKDANGRTVYGEKGRDPSLDVDTGA